MNDDEIEERSQDIQEDSDKNYSHHFESSEEDQGSENMDIVNKALPQEIFDMKDISPKRL